MRVYERQSRPFGYGGTTRQDVFHLLFNRIFRDLEAHGKQQPLMAILEKRTVEGNVNP